jgi:hypothetical protein
MSDLTTKPAAERPKKPVQTSTGNDADPIACQQSCSSSAASAERRKAENAELYPEESAEAQR